MLVRDHYDGHSDRIGDVYDYDLAIGAIKRIVASGHFNLLETLAERIAEACLASAEVERVTIRLEKPDVLPACRAVGIEIVRSPAQRLKPFAAINISPQSFPGSPPLAP